MSFPIQAPPVHRPTLVDPTTLYATRNLTEDQKTQLQVRLAFDSNFNDPQGWVFPTGDRMRVSGWPLR